MKREVGREVEKTWVISKTTTEESIKPITKDATTLSHLLTPSSTTMIKFIFHMLNHTPTQISLKTCARSSQDSLTMSPEILFAGLLPVTNVNTSQSPTECLLRLIKRRKESSLAPESTQVNPMLPGWWKESLTSWSAVILRLQSSEINLCSR